MKGVQKIAFVLLVCWWVGWGLHGQAAFNELERQGFNRSPRAAERVLVGDYDEDTKKQARTFLAARAAVKRAINAAIVLPALLLGVVCGFRWIATAHLARRRNARD